MNDRKKHWETVYETKSPNEVSWTQAIPQTSLDFINSFKLPKTAKIIDVGGGDSLLVDFLLEAGYQNITVLDISERALERAKARLGEKAELIQWVASDITAFNPSESFDVWHDRAAFHFLTEKNEISKYLHVVEQTVNKHVVVGTFSKQGPLKCSGLEIAQYSEEEMTTLFSKSFSKIGAKAEFHTTPFRTQQHFQFCAFKSKR